MKSKRIYIPILLLLAIGMGWRCAPPTAEVPHQDKRTSVPSSAPAKWSAELIPAPENTFGYDIYEDGRLLIHQPNIPALPGNLGFKTQQQALRAAALMIQKLEAGMMPPTVTVEEMEEISKQ